MLSFKIKALKLLEERCHELRVRYIGIEPPSLLSMDEPWDLEKVSSAPWLYSGSRGREKVKGEFCLGSAGGSVSWGPFSSSAGHRCRLSHGELRGMCGLDVDVGC